MACPALPLCGLAVTEAERGLPDLNRRFRVLLGRLGLGSSTLVVRMTGCPNGCARPYMAEIGLVGDGPNSYQVCCLPCSACWGAMTGYVMAARGFTWQRWG